MDILEQIIDYKRSEVARQKASVSHDAMSKALDAYLSNNPRTTIDMANALANSNTGIIAEFKRKSPSKGWIHETAHVQDVVPGYVKNGATALSILTDEHFFGGRATYIQRVRQMVDAPILRKDFIIDEYQLMEARLIGADAVLLIAAALSQAECKHLAAKAHQLGLQTLLEVHSEPELEYVGDNIDMVGVNNRNLGSFVVDVNNSLRLAAMLPSDYVLVSESGISQAETIVELRKAGYRGFLMGETFMKKSDPAQALADLVAKLTQNG